jgi:hypothetical protein
MDEIINQVMMKTTSERTTFFSLFLCTVILKTSFLLLFFCVCLCVKGRKIEQNKKKDDFTVNNILINFACRQFPIQSFLSRSEEKVCYFEFNIVKINSMDWNALIIILILTCSDALCSSQGCVAQLKCEGEMKILDRKE